MKPRALAIAVPDRGQVSGLLFDPPGADCLLALAHGAGAGMRHSFMETMAAGLGERGVATLRFQFPYMEAGKKRPDAKSILAATWRAAIAAAAPLAKGRPLFIGGKSMGGRIASEVAAAGATERIAGLVFFGYPLHAAGKPSTDRAAHLGSITAPMLFLQGTRDALANLDLIREVTSALGRGARLHIIDDGDHSFRVRKRSGRDDAAAWAEACDTAATWMHATAV